MQGWHIPTEEEFQTLNYFVGSSLNVNYAGKVLKSIEDGGTDELGFSGKVGRNMWTASEYKDIPDPELVVFIVGFWEGSSDWMIGAYGQNKTSTNYVRCIKDEDE